MKLQLLFLSLEAFEHFQHSFDDFVIDKYLKFDTLIHPSIENLKGCFQELDMLFKTKTEIILTHQNSNNFKFLSDFLRNPFLKWKWPGIKIKYSI
jgi:hypothetical protein